MLKRKKTVIIVILLLLFLITSTTYTFSYFLINQKVENSVYLKIGSIRSNFVMADRSTPNSSEIVNISNLTPMDSQSFNFYIKNSGTLTSKISLYFDNFCGAGVTYILPYLSYKLELDNKIFEGRFSDLATINNFQLKDNENNPILIESNDVVEGKITFRLDANTPYTTENKAIFFNINTYATQPNDPNWLY